MTKLYEAKNHILIHTGYADPIEHRHMAAHIIVSLNGQLRAAVNGAEYICRGILIPSGTPHRIYTDGKPVLVFLYDCTTEISRQIRNIQCISEMDCDKISEIYFDFERMMTADSDYRLEQYLWAMMGIAKPACCVTDERIAKAIEYIRAMAFEKITCRKAAEMVYLSQGRFSHLFKTQVGMTFAAYLVYQRIMYAYTEILQGRSITEAALKAGFSSSAHFADINRRVFGISAGSITRDMIFIKIQ